MAGFWCFTYGFRRARIHLEGVTAVVVVVVTSAVAARDGGRSRQAITRSLTEAAKLIGYSNGHRAWTAPTTTDTLALVAIRSTAG